MHNFPSAMVWRVCGSRTTHLVVSLCAFAAFIGSANGAVLEVNLVNSVCSNNQDCGDDNDAQPGDGIAERNLGGGGATLRAAIQEANQLEGHDIIVLRDMTMHMRLELPPLTDPAGVTIMSVDEGKFIIDGSTISARMRQLRDLWLANFADLDGDEDELLSPEEADDLIGLPDLFSQVRAIIHSFDARRSEDFDILDTNNDGFLDELELQLFRGYGTGLKMASSNNKIIGVSFIGFYDGGIIIDGEGADNNVIQGCYIGLDGRDISDQDDARILFESFDTLDDNESGDLELSEADDIIPTLTRFDVDRLDGDGDDFLTIGELTPFVQRFDGDTASALISEYADLNADNDDGLSLTEVQTLFPDLVATSFDRMDNDVDGILSIVELNDLVIAANDVAVASNRNGNNSHGITIRGGADMNLIGGDTEEQRNIISGNGTDQTLEILDSEGEGTDTFFASGFGNGILISGSSTSDNVVSGNYIGVGLDGDRIVRNAFSGVVIEGSASNNTVGGVNPGEGNLIAHNGSSFSGCSLGLCGNTLPSYYGRGVYVRGETSTGNVVYGNTIENNTTVGIAYENVNGGEIGDAVEGAGNNISGHSFGSLTSANIFLSFVQNVSVEGNVSTQSNSGLFVLDGSDITIGSPGFGNVFATSISGVQLQGCEDVTFQGNFVGVDATGTLDQGNSFSGMFIAGYDQGAFHFGVAGIQIGGTGPGEENIISGNQNDGIVIYNVDPAPGTDPLIIIEGNHIGTNAAGTAAIPNEVIGILLGPEAGRVRIGGTVLDGSGNNLSANVISGNGQDGIRVARRPNETGTPDNIQILGNRIGLAATGTALVGNELSGIALLQVDEEVRVGGFLEGESNIIAGNLENGVRVEGGNGIDVNSHVNLRGNTIYGNGAEGIFLEEQANDDIVVPSVVGVSPVTGTAPIGSTVDLFADSDDEGQFYLGSVIADGSGNFSLNVDLGTLQANNITAIATDLTAGNTSPFSDPLPLTPPVFSDHPENVSVVEGDPFTLTVAATGSEPITYQWEFLVDGGSEFVAVANDAVVSGATTTTLTNSAARLTDVGTYRCVATNILGDTPSDQATVMVLEAATNMLDVSTLDDGAVDGDVQSPAHLQLDPGTDGVISLREAIIAANNRAGADTINFASGGTITLDTGLPSLSDAVGGTTIDGGGEIIINGSNLAGSLAGFELTSADNVLTGLQIVGFPANGVEITGAGATGNTVSDCLIGNDGSVATANAGNGILISDGASDNSIGGDTQDTWNVLSGNSLSGVALTGADTTGNVVGGNLIGLDAAGTAGISNGQHGVLIEDGASENLIGNVVGDQPRPNIISANTRSGIYIAGDGTEENVVQTNGIGVSIEGLATLGNLTNGIAIVNGAANNVIGGGSETTFNLISGNAIGILVDGAETLGNTITQNAISENFGKGIVLTNGANGTMPAPTITMFGSVIGTAEAGSTVEIFVDEDDEGATLIATVVTNGDGDFLSEVDLETYAGMNITATATDADGNTSEFSEALLIDLEPPVLTLLGSEEVTVECGSGPYVDLGATAIDDVDGDISSQIQRTITRDGSPATVNTTDPGVYTILYEVSDNAGQVATPVQRVVTVTDTSAPVLTLNGTPAVVVECADDYTDAGAIATDACEGDVVVTVTGLVNGTVDTATPGVHVITYSAVDGAGNAATSVTRTVTVADRTKPTITLTGAPSVTLECGDGYVDAGATVADVCDANVMVVTENPVDPGVVGVYTVRYNAVDSSGNAADEVIRVVQVVDTTIPVITLIGGADITVACGASFQDLGATVEDSCEGALPAIVSGVVTTNAPGNYTLTYTASDAAGNVAEPVTRIVRVVDAQVPVITLIGSANVDVACEALYQELGATATDGCDGDLTNEVVTSGNVDTSVPGQYFVNYDVVDSFGNVANRVTRTVTVAVCPAPCENQCAGDPEDDIDEDGDGLSACIEACLGTSDAATDTDGDGVPDNVENETGSDPAVPDSDLDLDNDGLSHLEEFIFDSDPLDPNSPAESFFVAPQGANQEIGGSPTAPWSSITYALSQVTPTANNPVRLIIAEGNYPENVELVPWVTLVGASGTLPRIEGTVFGANNSAIENLEIAAFTSDDVMLVMDGIAMTVTDVVFRGSASRPAAGILADGSQVSGSVIEGCLFTSLSVGIDVGGSLPMIRRCTFEETSIAGVFVRSTANISSTVSLGDVTDPSTGSNLFVGVVEGRAVINEVETTLLAQQNDWGTTTASTIQSSLVSGNVVFEPVLEPGTAADTASLFITVWTAANQARIGTATVTVTDDSGAAVAVSRNQNGVYPLPVLRSGDYSVEVSAFGFETQTTTLSLAPRELGSRIVALQTPVIKAGGPSCSPNGGIAQAYWTDLLLVVLLLSTLLLDQRVGRFLLGNRRVK